MSTGLALAGMYPAESPAESRSHLPPEVSRLLEAGPGQPRDDAWAAFIAAYSGLLLRVASAFAPGYDGALDRYVFMLDELRKGDCGRLRKFAADGRGRFSTWLTVVARRLCLDHHRRQYGRVRRHAATSNDRSLARLARRALASLDTAAHDLANLPAFLEPDPTVEIDARDQRVLLRRVVGQLQPGDQLLLRLRFEEDLTAREMATVLGLPSPFHAYRRLDAIYKNLRKQLRALEAVPPRSRLDPSSDRTNGAALSTMYPGNSVQSDCLP
jgi:RNA polymerase sigma factor (sigma-70 family)